MRFGEVADFKVMPYYNKKITIVNKDDRPLRFQIPRMYMPFGVSGFIPPSGPTKWNIDFSMKGWDTEDGYINKFYNFLKSFENRIIEEVQKQSIEIFGRDVSHEELTGMFNSNIKPNDPWEPKFRVKIGDDANIFNEQDVELDIEFVDKLYERHTGAAIVEPQSIYFMQRKFGVTWKISQLKIYELQNNVKNEFMFRDVPPP
jgi:hypothetical protein